MLGLVLVAASIAGVVGLIATLDRSQAVYVAFRPIASGEVITEADLTVEQLSLGRSAKHYLLPDGEFSPVRTTRPIFAGELVPLRALGLEQGDLVNTVVTVTGPIPAELSAGALVDVWAAASGSQQSEDPARMIATEAEVVALRDAAGFASQSASEIELRVPRGKLPDLLAAVARGEFVTVVRVAG